MIKFGVTPRNFFVIACIDNWLKQSNTNLYNAHEYNVKSKKEEEHSSFMRSNINYVVRKDFKMCDQYNPIAIETSHESIHYTKNIIAI